MKTCRTCGEDKELDEYYYRKDTDSYKNECKDCVKQRSAKQPYDAAYFRNHHLIKTYGITQDEYEQMLKNQNHSCAICGINEKYVSNKRFHVDHDHDTGEIRGLLCSKCNQAIGLLQDSSDFCNSAAEYLKGFNK